MAGVGDDSVNCDDSQPAAVESLHTYQPLECACGGQRECWWCNADAPIEAPGDDDCDTPHHVNSASIADECIECLEDSDLDELSSAAALQLMNACYEPAPSDQLNSADFLSIGFDEL